MQLFLFECKKIAKKKTMWVASFLSIIAVIILYFFNNVVADEVHQGNIMRLQNNSVTFQNFVSDSEAQKKEALKNDDSEKVKEMTESIERYQKSEKKYETWKTYYIDKNWAEIYQKEIAELEELFEYSVEPVFALSMEEQPVSWFTAQVTLAEKLLLKDNAIEPFVQSTIYFSFLPTIYDQFTGTSLEQWKKETKRYGTTGLSFLYQMIQSFYIPAIILFGCFIFGNNISSEIGKKRRGLHFYSVMPIRKSMLFFAKYLSGLAYTLGFVLVMLLVPLVWSLFTKGVGSFNYPVLVYEGAKPNQYGSEFNALDPTKDQFHFMNLIDYLVQALGLTLVLVFFLYSLYYVLSLVIKNPSVTIILIVGIIFGGMKLLAPASYNPFIYMDIHKVLNGEAATLAFNPAITFENGLLLFFGLGCLLMLLGYWRFRRM